MYRHVGRTVRTWFVALVVVGLAAAGSALADGSVPMTVWDNGTGTLYALSPGVEGGQCTLVGPEMRCTSPDGSSGASASATGCGSVFGKGFCLVVPVDWTPPDPLPFASSTLECPDKNYELSVDGGRCTPNNGKHMKCSDGGVNNAEADCETGCGTITGSGKCKPVSKP
ncbi:MAG: hypothetical protein D6738_14145 [Acidobacteria bacterium]|nr:MAG: hypothetical protein D6738_14145 [Acidobacteriota bacterium]